MNKLFIAVALAGLMIILEAACGSATPVPTPTSVPQIPTSTPIVTQEWELEGLAVTGSTVTVSVRVYAEVQIDVSFGGTPPSWVNASSPLVEYIFEEVAAGEHAVEISDVVGFSQTASVVVKEQKPVNGELPDWLAKWVADLDAGKIEFPPNAVFRFQDQGGTVYYVDSQCCDQFSDLLDADGNLIGHPDGGITGQGDGVTPFLLNLHDGEIIWSSNK